MSCTYDAIGRVKTKSITSGTTTYTINYTYVAGTAANGNILTTVVNGKNIKYYYNSLNELTREDNEVIGKTITYIQRDS